MAYKKLEYKEKYSNPGFKVGDVIYWDDAVVSLNFQPYPFIGRVTHIHSHGCFVFNQYSRIDDGHLFYSWKQLCRIGCVLDE